MLRIIAGAASLLVVTALETQACKFLNPNHGIVRKSQDHGATYHGTVLASALGEACGATHRLITLKVIKAFGADAEAGAGDTVTVFSASQDAMCGVNYAIGTEVVIFSDKVPSCTGPGPNLSTSQADFNEVAPSKAQLDSLYLGVPTALSGPGSARSGRQGIRAGAGRMRFIRPDMADESECQADGRWVSP